MEKALRTQSNQGMIGPKEISDEANEETEVSGSKGGVGISRSMRQHSNPRGVSDVRCHKDELAKSSCQSSSLFETLKVDKLKVSAPLPHQLNVIPGFGDLAIFEHVNYVGIPDSAQSVSHGDGGATLGSGV